MADDNLKFTEDYIAFACLPEQTADFIKNDTLWDEKDLEKILKEREKALILLNNDSKDLDFLPQNRLIYAFQKNIVKNKKFSKYFKWFDLAEKTRNKNNTKLDFELYEKDKILMAVMQRIQKNALKLNDLRYIKNADSLFEGGIGVGIAQGIEKGIEQGIEKGIEIGESKKSKEIVIIAYLEGFNNPIIAKLTKLPVNEVERIIEEYKMEQGKKN